MKKVDEEILWYEQNADSLYEDIAIIELEKINKLYDLFRQHDDGMFVESMIDSFFNIIEAQKEKINDLQTELVTMQNGTTGFRPMTSNFVSLTESALQQGDFQSDKQLQDAFTLYCLKNGKSSYTVNDYCSRIKSLWNTFYDEFKSGKLPKEIIVIEDEIKEDSPLLNAYNYKEELSCYISMKLAGVDGNRNWANARAAFNKFGEAVCGEEYKSIKNNSAIMQPKDFSKYLFNGEVFGKSRLILAVVKYYTTEKNPENFAELQKVFPDFLQGSKGVVKLLEDISDKDKGISGVKRYFTNADEIIVLRSGEHALVCTQWGNNNIDQFVEHVTTNLGYKIEKV